MNETNKICECFEGWTGKTCAEIKCLKNLCKNNGNHFITKGSCYIDDGRRFCNCTPGWKGESCHIRDCNNIHMCGENGTYIN